MDSETPFISAKALKVKFQEMDLSLDPTTRTWMKKHLLLALTILSVVVGLLLGCLLRLGSYDDDFVMLIGLPGDILMRMLKVLIVPLIVSSIIAGMAQLKIGTSKRMAFHTILYYSSTTMVAVVLGVIMVLMIHPGDPSMKNESISPIKAKISTMDTLLDLGRSMFPENLFKATFSTRKTEFVKGPRININENEPGINWNRIITETVQNKNQDGMVISTEVQHFKMIRSFTFKEGSNLLGLIVFCTAFGIIAGKIGSKAEPTIRFFESLNEIILRLVSICMWYSPVGIASLITAKILAISDISTVAHQLGLYIFTVISGLFIHGFVTLPLIYYLITKRNPFTFFRGILQAFFTALGTGSSAATLPITFRCLEDNNNIDNRVTRTVLPLGVTINMDGTALYEAVAAIFIAQMNGIAMSFGQIIAVSVTATAASIGASSVPSAGLVTMIMVLTSVGLPIEDIAVLVAVDWFLDRIRTSINVLGDAFGAGIVNHLSNDELECDLEAANDNKGEMIK